ncbi:outer membrane OprD family porin [Pseudomonas duriflava]|uniref:Outer membrane OprD family porin n=1 Tax=Pseudomonas duriflava TaxID=459528 RepID=A0A562QNQ4_9PSED|nr:OprD family porin [Pseudomonas duriflava]TWI58325.1 outer membrane OprD family porin [Pseudomonas duriflava]
MTLRYLSAPTLLGLAPFALALGLPATASAAGFVEDAKVNVMARNYYFNRDFRNSSSTQQSKQEEWAQGFIFTANSGFTEGTVGFGLDITALYGFKLDSSADRSGTQLLPTSTRRPGQLAGEAADDFGRVGATFKAKVSKTELRVGELMPNVPVLRFNDGRLLPQTFQGATITSKELDGFTFYGAQIRQVSLRNSSDMQDMTPGRFTNAESDRFNYVGGEYTFNEKKTMVGLWHARLEDVYKQNFYNLTHAQKFGDWTLGANLGYFTGKEEGSALAGNLDNKLVTAMLSAGIGGHKVSVGLQKVSGDDGWLSLAGTSGGTLANDMFVQSFDNAKERSWQLRYDYNFAAMGIPGLALMARYGHGDNIHTSTTDDGSQWERNFDLAYTFQGGPLKNLNMRWRNTMLRRDFGSNNDIDENRLIFSYPLSLL